MRFAVSGKSGLIGSALEKSLEADGHTVTGLPRLVESPESLEGADVVVHLAGASIGEGRWTRERRREIMQSRVEGTRRLVQALSACKKRPSTLISGSAVGFYGDRGNEELDESKPHGAGFLPEVCEAWESEALKAASVGVRVALLRSGVVLSRDGGAFPRMLQPFRWFVGGPLGQGQQWMSWIHIADEIRVIRFLSENQALEGPVNATAPNPITNLDFARELGRILDRPSLVRAPAFAIKAAMGREMAEELLLTSQRVLPAKLLSAGFEFRHPTLAPALRELLKS